jgi:hypothetical protein
VWLEGNRRLGSNSCFSDGDIRMSSLYFQTQQEGMMRNPTRNLAALSLLLMACGAPTAPTDTLTPQFQKVYQGGEGGGHGGGAGGGTMVCEYPKHWSSDCASKRAKAQATTVTSARACAASGWNVAVCTAGGIGTGIAWGDYSDTPGDDGIASDHDWPYDPNYGPNSYPACQFACQTRNDPPFNAIPGGGYGYGYW